LDGDLPDYEHEHEHEHESMIYLDHHATTPIDPAVLEAMMPYMTGQFGNAASTQHNYGKHAAAAVGKAREQVGRLVGAEPQAITFTSGATESINLALRGLMTHDQRRGDHIVTARTEHPAVLETCRDLEANGCRLSVLDVDGSGHVDLEALRSVIADDTAVVSIMAANNEIGTIHDIAGIGAVCREASVFFHCDAAQALGRVPINVNEMHIDILSGSAHKLYGPKGAGMLYCRRRDPRVRLTPLLTGGGHERGLRPGTINVPAVVGFGAACDIAGERMNDDCIRIAALRDSLQDLLLTALPDATVNGDQGNRLPGNLSLSVPGVDGARLLRTLPDVALSTGSACSSAVAKPSHVLRAIGVDADLTMGSIRFGLGRGTTSDEVETAAAMVIEAVAVARQFTDIDKDEPVSCRA
jgi:cysteine desulfurase